MVSITMVFLQDLQGCLATSVHDEVPTQYKVPAKLQGDKVASCQVYRGFQIASQAYKFCKPDSPIQST